MKTEINITLTITFSGDITGSERTILQNVCEAVHRQVYEDGIVDDEINAYTTGIYAKDEEGNQYMTAIAQY